MVLIGLMINGINMNLLNGKLNILIDGQFGSTGKGLLSSYIGSINHIDLSITNSSPNAGHTFYFNNRKYVFKHLPVTCITNDRSIIYLCAGSIINPDILLQEILQYDIDSNRISIHPNAAVIEQDDILYEQEGACLKLSSTQNGVGKALSRKINRESKLAKGCDKLKPFINEIDISYYLDCGCVALIEVPQGMDLSLVSGLEYPYCTSREITISQALSDCQLHPKYLGNVVVCLRTYPIRVGNIIKDGKEVGYSGPFYNDSIELTWDELHIDPEYTTNTNRIRRVATFSIKQYRKMLRLFNPNFILLNFCNYMNNDTLSDLLQKLPEITHLSFGPSLDDIIQRNYYEI